MTTISESELMDEDNDSIDDALLGLSQISTPEPPVHSKTVDPEERKKDLLSIRKDYNRIQTIPIYHLYLPAAETKPHQRV